MGKMRTLTCRHCSGEMRKAKVSRFGGCLSVLGNLIGIVGLVLMGLGCLPILGLVAVASSDDGGSEQRTYEWRSRNSKTLKVGLGRSSKSSDQAGPSARPRWIHFRSPLKLRYARF